MTGAASPDAEHHFEAHTGEVCLEVTAPTREALFEEAGRGLADLMLRELPEPDADAAAEVIEVRASDEAALLVEWLNELVFLSEVRKQVFTRFRVERVDEATVRATAWGVHPEVLRTAVKAVTLHGARLDQGPGGWRASLVLDV